MALSNIFREPRREVTETALGAAVILPLLYADYRFGMWFGVCPIYGEVEAWRVIYGMLFGFMGIAGLIGLGFGIHAAGEGLCNRLQDAGIRLRPRQRR